MTCFCPRALHALLISACCLLGAAPLSSQDLDPFRVGLLFFKQDQPLDAAERWLVQAERLREGASQSSLRSAGYGYVMATMAYEAADDDRAYGTWAEAVRVLLEAQTRWDLERERLAARLADVSSLLAGIDAAETPSISDEILLLTELQETLQLTEYQGPRIGLSSPRTEVSALETDESRDYFAKPLALSDSESRSRFREQESENSSGRGAVEAPRIGPDPSAASEVEPLPTRVAPLRESASPFEPADAPPPPSDAAGAASPLRGSGNPLFEDDVPTEAEAAIADPRTLPAESGEKPPSAVRRAVARATARTAEEPEVVSRSRVAPVEPTMPTVGAAEELIVFGPQIEVTVLDEEEMESARIAWRYVQENLQVTSGFANAVNKYATLSIWEMGSLVASIVAAHQLGIVPKVRFDSMLDRVLESLGRIPIYRDEMPNLEYNSATGQMIDTRHRETERGSGFSSLDTGRLLVWLRIVKEWYPEKAGAVDAVVARFDFERATGDGELHSVRLERAQEVVEQQGRLGYEQYAATGFALWRNEVESAMDLDQVDYREIYGVSVPYDRRGGSFLTSEAFILAGLELGSVSPDFARLTKAVFDVQQRRWEEDDVLTALSEDSLSQPPWFIYGSIVHGEATWNAFNSGGQMYEQYLGLSTKAAFGWHALYANAFTRRLVEVASQLEHPRYGFFAGLFENGEVNEALSLNTNAVVLESILYRQRGNRPFLQIEFEQGATRGYRRR